MDWKEYMERLFWKKIQRMSTINKHEWKALSIHPFLRQEMVLVAMNGDWDWRLLSRQSHDWKRDLILRFPWKPWDWGFLSSDLPFEFIHQHPHLNWDLLILWKRFSTAPSKSLYYEPLQDWTKLSDESSLSFIFRFPHLPWKWKQVSKNPSLQLKDVLFRPHLPWDFSYIMKHVYFSSIDIRLQKTRSLRIDYKLLSLNPFCRPFIVRTFLNKDWDWGKLAIHPAFPPQLIIRDPVLSSKWRWDRCLGNPRLDLHFYSSLKREIVLPNQFSQLVQNHFEKSLELFPYQLSVLVRFVWSLINRKRIFKKLFLLKKLGQNMDPVFLEQILFLYI
jgi:hypothetical protein